MPLVRAVFLFALLSGAVLLTATPARPAAQPSGARASLAGAGLKPLLPGHYVYIHTDDAPGVSATFNSGIIVTSDGVVVVDALSSEAIAQRVRQAVAGITT